MLTTLKITAASLAVLAFTSACSPTNIGGTSAPTVEANGSVLSAGDRALAMWEVQKVMSVHEYMHAAGMNLEEVDAIWVKRDGPYASMATFGSPAWVMNGLEVIRGAYGEENQRNREKTLKAISEIDPDVLNIAENYGAGHEWVMHTSTTPIIEIASDGKTAQGYWYSPGMGVMAKMEDGKIGASGSIFFEKYAGDFILEDGQWKIWHLQMAYDFVPGLPQEMIDPILKKLGDKALWPTGKQEVMRQAGEQASFGLPEGFIKPLYSYPDYSPQRPGLLWPPLPKPYKTFSETTSYCNCKQELPF